MSITYNPLWKTLVDKNMNKEDLRKLTGISPSTMAKMSKDEYVALRVIDDICEALNVKSISQVVEYVCINDDIVKETNLDMLGKLVDLMASSKANGIPLDNESQGVLYRLLIKAIEDRAGRSNSEDAEQFYITYTKCITNNLLPPKLAMETIQALINKDGSEPPKKTNNKMRWPF